MESDITVKATPNEVITAFDLVNIRLYEPVNYNGDVIDYNKSINYKIRIRHNEGENPKQLFYNAVNCL